MSDILSIDIDLNYQKSLDGLISDLNTLPHAEVMVDNIIAPIHLDPVELAVTVPPPDIKLLPQSLDIIPRLADKQLKTINLDATVSARTPILKSQQLDIVPVVRGFDIDNQVKNHRFFLDPVLRPLPVPSSKLFLEPVIPRLVLEAETKTLALPAAKVEVSPVLINPLPPFPRQQLLLSPIVEDFTIKPRIVPVSLDIPEADIKDRQLKLMPIVEAISIPDTQVLLKPVTESLVFSPHPISLLPVVEDFTLPSKSIQVRPIIESFDIPKASVNQVTKIEETKRLTEVVEKIPSLAKSIAQPTDIVLTPVLDIIKVPPTSVEIIPHIPPISIPPTEVKLEPRKIEQVALDPVQGNKAIGQNQALPALPPASKPLIFPRAEEIKVKAIVDSVSLEKSLATIKAPVLTIEPHVKDDQARQDLLKIPDRKVVVDPKIDTKDYSDIEEKLKRFSNARQIFQTAEKPQANQGRRQSPIPDQVKPGADTTKAASVSVPDFSAMLESFSKVAKTISDVAGAADIFGKSLGKPIPFAGEIARGAEKAGRASDKVSEATNAPDIGKMIDMAIAATAVVAPEVAAPLAAAKGLFDVVYNVAKPFMAIPDSGTNVSTAEQNVGASNGFGNVSNTTNNAPAIAIQIVEASPGMVRTSDVKKMANVVESSFSQASPMF